MTEEEAKGLIEILSQERTTVGELLAQSLTSEFVEAVHGYTDWLAAQVVKNGTGKLYPLQNVFQLLPAATPAICKKYGIQETILLLVIAKLHKLKTIPLVGTIEKGMIIPDTQALNAWKSQFAGKEDSKNAASTSK